MKSIKKNISCIMYLLIVMVFMLSLSACNSDNSGSLNETGDNKTLNIYELYGSDYFSFANINIASVSDTVYCDLDNLNSRYLILEGIVEEDYYCKLNKGTVVDIPICLNKTADSYLDVNSVVELLSQNETIFIYFREANNSELCLYPQNDKVQFPYLASAVSFNFFDMILCTNGKADLYKTCAFLDGQGLSYVPYNLHGDYTNYIDDKMDIDTVASNIAKLYEKIKIIKR